MAKAGTDERVQLASRQAAAASEGGALELAAARRRLGHFLPLPSLQEPAAPAPAAGEGKKGSAEYIQSPASTAPHCWMQYQ